MSSVKLGPYEVVSEIGRGGVGLVYRGRAPDGRDVAIKLLLHMDRGKALARFDRERRILISLGEAEGFIPLLDDGDSDKGPYIVMPFVGGGTLRDRLRTGALPPAEVRRIGIALAAAIGRAHAQGIVHRDLKPENVLFTLPTPASPGGDPLIADLGLGKHLKNATDGGGGQSRVITSTGELAGTMGYMAPEQVRSAKEVGPPADVFSIGAILYECLTGREAFSAECLIDFFDGVATAAFEPIEKVMPGAPPRLAAAIERAILKDPTARYADGAVFAIALADAVDAPRAPPRSRAPLAVLGVLAILVVGGLGAFLLTRGSGPAKDAGTGSTPPPVIGAKDPKATVATPPPLVIPELCRGFLKTGRTKLASVAGRYAWKHAQPVQGVSVSPDGKLVAAGGLDAAITLWDSETGEVLRTLLGHAGGVRGVAFTPDGKKLVSAGDDGTVRVWDVSTGATTATLTGHEGIVRGIAIAPDGKRAASAGDDTTVRLWDLDAGRALGVFRGHAQSCTSVSFSRDGRRLISGSRDMVAKVWDPKTLDVPERTRPEPFTLAPFEGSGITAVALTPDDAHAVLCCGNGRMFFFSTATQGAALARFELHDDDVWSFAISPDGKQAASASNDHKVILWNLGRGGLTHARTIEGRESAASVAWFPDGKRLAVGGADRTVRILDAATGRDLRRAEARDALDVRGLALLRDGRHALSAGRDPFLRQWDLETGEVRALDAGVPVLSSVAVSRDERLALTGSEKGAQLWDLAHWARAGALEAQPGPVAGVAFSDGSHALSATADGRLHVFDLDSSAESAALPPGKPGPDAAPIALAATPDGLRALVSSSAGLKLWDLAAKKPVAGFAPAVAAPVTCLAVLPDAASAVAGTTNGTAEVLDLATGRKLRALVSKGALEAVALSADGKLALASSADGAIRLFDLATGEALDALELASSADVARSLAFTQDGRAFVAGTARGVILRFELSPR